MAATRRNVLAAAAALFPAAESERILALVDTYGVETYERERERVQLAILGLSGGDEEKLRYYLEVAKQDYRDVLLWWDEPEASRIDTPEKRRQVRELFGKLGLPPPKDLQD